MTIKQLIGRTVLLSMFFFTSSVAQAACKERDVIAMLTRGGFAFSSFDTVNENLIGFELTKDGLTSELYVDADDGDLSFRRYYTDDLRLAKLNSINNKFKFVTVTRDEDDDIKVRYDYPHWGKGCVGNLSDNIILWYSLLNGVVDEIVEVR